MSLAADDLLQIEALLVASGSPADAFAELRRRFPGLSLTRCEASDLDAVAPFRHYRRFDIHLVDGHDHCWRLTCDPARATGIVVATRLSSVQG